MGDYHNSEIEDIPFDTAEGSRILEEAGYVDSDGDGIREDLGGNPMEYRFYAEDGATEARVLEIIADGLAEIGVSAMPTLLDVDSMMALYPDFDFDLLFWGWEFDADPDLAMLVFTCDERAEGGWQDSGYCDEEFDAMYAAQDAALTREGRAEILWEMQEKLFEERPYVMLTYQPTVEAYRSDRFTLSEDCGFLVWKACLLHAEILP
jgi:peptide/nickel transport system substrate-binding protein